MVINVIVFADDGVRVVNWTHIAGNYAVAGNDVRLNVSTPPGVYTGIGYCRAQVGIDSLTDGGSPVGSRREIGRR